MSGDEGVMCADGCAGCSAECAACASGCFGCSGCDSGRLAVIEAAARAVGRKMLAVRAAERSSFAALTGEQAGRGLQALMAEVEILQAEAEGDFDLLGEFVSRLPEQLQDYWTTGEGGRSIRWCTKGAFDRARRKLRKYVQSPEVLDGLVANLYHRACGHWPGEKKG